MLESTLEGLGELKGTERMPAVFVGHGSPLNAIRESQYTSGWVELGRTLPRPKGILMVSAHWLTRGQCLVSGDAHPKMNYDMYGFPPETYQVRYPAPGNVTLARTVSETVRHRTPVHLDSEWGYDHGAWLPLMYMFPKADVPLIQLSIDYSQPPSFQYELASDLKRLRSKGVLIIGSGNVVHNLARRGEDGAPPYDWAEEFDATITQRIQDGDDQSVIDFLELGHLASLAHPTYEHFLPLLSILGVRFDGEQVRVFNAGFQNRSVSMKSFVIF